MAWIEEAAHPVTKKHRVHLHVAGAPAPKGSRTVGHRKDGSHFTRESSKRAGPWTEQVAYCARANRLRGKPLEPPYEIEIVFAMPSPSVPKYDWPTGDGDLDKLVRGTLDGLVQGGLLVDDRHVVELTARKRFAAPGGTGAAISVA